MILITKTGSPNASDDVSSKKDNNDVNEPSAAVTTTTISPDQGKNGLDYDIDVRFNDGKTDNSRNQQPLDTTKP